MTDVNRQADSSQPHDHPPPQRSQPAAPPAAADAPPTAGPTRWERAKFAFQAVEVRLRFILILVGIGLLVTYWTTLQNYWDRWTRPQNVALAAHSDSEFYCPMHPNVTRAELEPDGSIPKCPICGMPLSKRKKGEAPELPEGVVGRVQLSPERIRQAGVEVTEAVYRPLEKEVRAVGYVDYDESRLSRVVSRVGGYLEKLYVDKTFVTVEQDQPLAEIYSPELYSTVQELLLAQRRGLKDLTAAGRRRLELLGIDEREIDKVLESRDPRHRLVIRSPQAGHVIEKNVLVGASVEPGTTLLKVADLSTVWIEADVFEKDVSFLQEGQDVEATVESFPGRVFHGKVSLVHPHLETDTRTNRIRMAVDNPEHLLRPGMFASVTIKAPMTSIEPFRTRLASFQAATEGAAGNDQALIDLQENCPVTGKKLGSMGPPVKTTVDSQTVFLCCAGCEETVQEKPDFYLARLTPPTDAVLTVPQRAVIDTGTQKVVFVEREPGLFEAVSVELGPRSGEYYPVIRGLLPGDRVAAGGAFLLDAETRLNPAAASTYFGASGAPAGGHAGHGARGDSARSTSASQRGPREAQPPNEPGPKQPSAEDLKNIARLPVEDQALARQQQVCPITDEPLGSMGVPVKMTVKGQEVFLCCEGCRRKVEQNPKEVLEKVHRLRTTNQRAEQP